MRRTRVAVIGAGYWGINHVRTFGALAGAELTWVCDPSAAALQRAREIAPGAAVTETIEDVLHAGDVDAVVLATPATSHAELSERVLATGRHLLVEKPLALSVDDAARVQAAATRAGVVAMVGHLMVFHPALEQLRAYLRSGELGDVYYLTSVRANLGRLRSDENALWSFGPHDLSMIDVLLDEAPVTVAARGLSCLQPGIEDVVFVTLRFAGGQMAHVHLSWLSPRKERRLVLVCSQKMVEFDDVSADKLRIYDKGYDRPPEFTRFDQFLTMRQGDVHIPQVPMVEPLDAEARHFLECCATGATPRSDLASGLRVVRVLAAAERSLARDGAPVTMEEIPT